MRFPNVPWGSGFPSSSIIHISIPKNLQPADPGFIGVNHASPANVERDVMVSPFVYFIQSFPLPNTSLVQYHVSASNGSPTRETTSKHERLYLFNASFPKLLNIRSAVGAVNSLFTRYLSII